MHARVFERATFKHVFNHFRDNIILTSLQSGIISGGSTVNQLTYLYNTFSQTIDFRKEVRVVFCDISKAFGRVWHEGLFKKSLKLLVYLEIFFYGSVLIYLIDVRELFFLVLSGHGNLYELVFLMVLSLVLFFFYFLLMTL